MDFADLVRTRRMVRRYDPERPVERETVQELLNCAIRAPSAGHTQGWRFLVCDDITSRSRFWTAAATGPTDAWRRGMMTAPVLVVCFSDRRAYLDRYAAPDKLPRHQDAAADRDPYAWQVPYWDVDTGMAALLLLLAAHDRGLGACFFGVPGSRWDALTQEFSVPAGLRPVGVVSLGHLPTGDSAALRPPRRQPRRRRSVAEVAVFGSFG